MDYHCVIDAWGKHEAELRGYLNRQLGDIGLAEDLLQSTFLKAIAEGAGFCVLENPRAWLFRVARNLLADHFRRAREDVELDEEPPVVEKEIPAIESLAECLPHALQALAPEDRDAIEHCDLDGMKQAAYANSKGLSLAAAKSRVQRARKRLKHALEQRCEIRFDEQGVVCCYSPRKKAD